MKNLEMMKQYIREHNLCGRVRELVEGADMDSADAIEYGTMPTRSASRHSWLSTSGKEG